MQISYDLYMYSPGSCFSGSIEYWPFSTRAELAAIWSALLVTPGNTKVKIKTDSQAAIDGLTTALKITGKRKWFNINNRSLINDIVYIIKYKKLEIQLIKVKAHSGIKGNELADTIAKGGCFSSLGTVDIDQNNLGNLRYCPSWNSLSIKSKIRKFVSKKNMLQQQALWSTNRDIRKYCYPANATD